MPNPVLILSGGDLTNSVQSVLNLSTNNRITVVSSPLKSLSMTLNPGLGTFSGTFTHPATRKRTAFEGAVLQDQKLGWGRFVSAQKSGLVYFGTPP